MLLYMISPEEEKKEDVWRSCCFLLDKGCIAYSGQFIFSLSTLSFCAVMLVQAEGDCNKSSAYINIISFMLGKILSSVLSSKD